MYKIKGQPFSFFFLSKSEAPGTNIEMLKCILNPEVFFWTSWVKFSAPIEQFCCSLYFNLKHISTYLPVDTEKVNS